MVSVILYSSWFFWCVKNKVIGKLMGSQTTFGLWLVHVISMSTLTAKWTMQKFLKEIKTSLSGLSWLRPAYCISFYNLNMQNRQEIFLLKNQKQTLLMKETRYSMLISELYRSWYFCCVTTEWLKCRLQTYQSCHCVLGTNKKKD